MAEVQEPYEGQLFNSYEEFNDYIQQYCRATAQTFVTDDSKKVERANEKLAPDKQFPTSLRYSYLKLTCVKFGDKHTKKCRPLTGARPTQRFGFIVLVTQGYSHFYIIHSIWNQELYRFCMPM